MLVMSSSDYSYKQDCVFGRKRNQRNKNWGDVVLPQVCHGVWGGAHQEDEGKGGQGSVRLGKS